MIRFLKSRSNLRRACVTSFTGIAVASAGCAQQTSPIGSIQSGGSAWQVSSKVDRISGKPSTSISVGPAQAKYSSRGSRGGFASASVLCADGSPMIMFVFDFPVGSTGTSVVGYRFDEKPGQTPKVDFFNSSSPVISDASAVATFLDQAQTSAKLYVRVSSPVGQSDVEFSVNGGGEPIRQFLTTCAAAPKKSA